VPPLTLNHPAERRLFGKRLRELRNERGWSQEKLAEAAGMSRYTVYRVENGDNSLLLDRVFDLCDALGVPALELFRWSHER
jgi:transcriptional regulator with XRE-family HTH domain